MDAASQIIAILRADPIRWHLLSLVRDLDLPDGWIGAGFVRNAVWDHRHGRRASAPNGDVDVIFYDRLCVDPAAELNYEASLRAVAPAVQWSVKNQARMHIRNGDAPYASVSDAMRYWPETATAVAVRRIGQEDCEVAAPFGLTDLFNLILRPTPKFIGERRHIYAHRVRSKRWLHQWPMLREEGG